MAMDILSFDEDNGVHVTLNLTFAGSDTSGAILSISGFVGSDPITQLDTFQGADNVLLSTFPYIDIFGISFDTQSGVRYDFWSGSPHNNQVFSLDTNNIFEDHTAFYNTIVLQVDVTPVQLSVSVPLANANQHPSVPYGTPFAGVVISDALSQTETVTITGAAVMPRGQSGPPLANLLIDPNWATDGGHFTNGGTYVFTGSLAAVNTDLNALQVLPFGHAINLQVSVTDAAGATAVGDHPISILGISTDHPPVHV